MIISRKYKYLFIAVPRTGSSTITEELCELYDGEPLLEYHSNYFEFARHCSEEEKKYFVFCGVRNPLDDAVSLYMKFITDHDKGYTLEEFQLDKGGYMSKRRIEIYNYLMNVDSSFATFLRNYYSFTHFPYTSSTDLNGRHCNSIIRLENLEQDFTSVLQKLGIKKKRPLGIKNPTSSKKDFLSYYSDIEIRQSAIKIFGPAMEKWGYSFPGNWGAGQCGIIEKARYRLMKKLGYLYARHFIAGAFKQAYWLRNQIQ